MRLIALTGYARSGKNTVASIIREEANTLVNEIAFADPMKDFCREVFGFSEAQLYGNEREKPDARWTRPDGTPLTARFALQTLGTEWGRACDPNLWVKAGINRARRLFDSGATLVVFTDCRFLNEARAVSEAGGEVWRIRRDVPQLSHASEREIWSPEMNEFVSAEIDNSESLEATRIRVVQLLMHAR